MISPKSFGNRGRIPIWQNEKTDHAVPALNVIFRIPSFHVIFKLIGRISTFPEQKGKMSLKEEIIRWKHPEPIRKNFQVFHWFLNGKIAEDKRRKDSVSTVLMSPASEKKGKFVFLTADPDGNPVLFIGQKEPDQFYINLRQKYVERNEDRRQG